MVVHCGPYICKGREWTAFVLKGIPDTSPVLTPHLKHAEYMSEWYATFQGGLCCEKRCLTQYRPFGLFKGSKRTRSGHTRHFQCNGSCSLLISSFLERRITQGWTCLFGPIKEVVSPQNLRGWNWFRCFFCVTERVWICCNFFFGIWVCFCPFNWKPDRWFSFALPNLIHRRVLLKTYHWTVRHQKWHWLIKYGTGWKNL